MRNIANVKHWYRSFFSFQYLIPALDKKEPLAFDVYKALTIIVEAWGRVSSRTTSRCFRKAGFGDQNNNKSDDNKRLPASEIAARMSTARREEFTENDAHRAFDRGRGPSHLRGGGSMDDNDIANVVQERSAEPDDEEPVIIKEKRPSMDDYLKATEVCQRCWMLAEPLEVVSKYLPMATALKTAGIMHSSKHRRRRLMTFQAIVV